MPGELEILTARLQEAERKLQLVERRLQFSQQQVWITQVEVLICLQPGIREVDERAAAKCWVKNTVTIHVYGSARNLDPSLLSDAVKSAARSHRFSDGLTRYAYAEFVEEPFTSKRCFVVLDRDVFEQGQPVPPVQRHRHVGEVR